MNAPGIRFLALDEVRAVHADQIDRYGGSHGIRDEGLLRSALAQPEAEFDGAYLHDSISAMAAAYLFHLVKNHPFVDGNKRIGTACATVFLELNGYTLDSVLDETDASGKTEFETVVLAVAEGRTSKDALKQWIESVLLPAE